MSGMGQVISSDHHVGLEPDIRRKMREGREIVRSGRSTNGRFQVRTQSVVSASDKSYGIWQILAFIAALPNSEGRQQFRIPSL